MDLDDLDALCDILAAHTVKPQDCYFGLCTIQGWLDSFAPHKLKQVLRLPWDRDFIVLAGPLSAVGEIKRDWSRSSSGRGMLAAGKGGVPSRDDSRFDWKIREAPNLIWPSDHTWFVASEVDFDSTVVGGSAELIQAIVESPALEAWAVEPSTSLTADADKINTPSR